MDTIATEAWVLYQGAAHLNGSPGPGELQRERIEFAGIGPDELLVEPIYGCWEANMTHALDRQPIDVCRQRREPKIVLGNAGVLRVLQVGEQVTGFSEGDLGILFCNGEWDRFGYTVKVFAYDAPGTIGVLAKRTKVHQRQIIKIPDDADADLTAWAAFSLRYVTAWANWNVARRCWQSQMPDVPLSEAHVWGWGGGVTLAELALARLDGCQTAMLSSLDSRLKLIEESGIDPIDRRQFGELEYDEERYQTDSAYRAAFNASEASFLETVREKTGGAGVAIFVDNIGLPVFRPTLKALARQGVVTTAGWKCGMNIATIRALECINRHIHVHTHYASYAEGVQAVDTARQTGWMAPVDSPIYGWDEIPRLAADYSADRIDSYFPLFAVNPL